MFPYILLFLGLLFIWIEFYVPGGAMAIAGVLFLFAAVISAFMSSASLLEICIFVLLTLVSVIAVIRLAIWRIKKSGKSNTFFLSRDQEGYLASKFDETMIGKKGMTLTDLGPAGYVLIDGKRYAALCRGPYVDKGVEVVVLGGEVAHLVVKPVK